MNQTLDMTLESTRQLLLKNVLANLQRYVEFDQRIIQDIEGMQPRFYQSVRMHALQQNKRILVADDTGFGKTYTFVGGKLQLDKDKREKHNALIISPFSGMEDAWHPDEINRYASYMRMPPQNVVTVNEMRDL
ncbi:MAG: hypothetical protein RL557_611 [archaeon]|jgi:superfamily II DNA or RNA helicase